MKQGIVWVLGLTLLATFTPGIVEVVNAGTTTQSFSYTGATQTWSVPSGVTTLTYTVIGAAGGGNFGGHGESMTGSLSVTPGQTLYFNVGQRGQAASNSFALNRAFNGGGSSGYFSTGGGGASDIRTGTDTSTQLIVAGGGGGAYNITSQGGNGGYPNGTAGANGGNNGEIGGGGGTQSAGGTAGVGSAGYSYVPGLPGGRGYGGDVDSQSAIAGGGGGGGYYGGGSGGAGSWATGGGGGSSWYNSSYATLASYSYQATLSDGSINVTYTVKTYPTMTLGLAGGGVNATYRTTIQLQATVAAAGFVRFYYQGKTIGTCQHVAVSGSTATCNWKPAIHGVVLVTANFTPADSSSYYPVSAGPLYVSTVPRATTR